MGVHGLATSIHIESQSFNQTYDKEDISGELPPNMCCRMNGMSCIQTQLDVDQMCDYTNTACNDINCKIFCQKSDDPGK